MIGVGWSGQVTPVQALVPVRPGGSRAAAPDQMLTAVSPGNGESVAEAPAEVRLTFASQVPDDVRIEVRTPDGTAGPQPVAVTGAGTVVTAAVPPDGPGGYTVTYRLGELTGETGFTVLAPGQAPPVGPGTTSGAVISIALAAVLVAVVVLTVRRWMTR